MIAPFQKLLDKVAIRLATGTVRTGWRRMDQTLRCAELLASKELLAPEVSAAPVEFQGKIAFTFKSPIEGPWDAGIGYGRFRRAEPNWQQRPAVILVHGWNGEGSYYWCFPWIERALAARGINALTFELPFHGRRRPAAPGAIQNMISDDLVTMIQSVQHALGDALALRKWLLAQGCPSVSLWGYSLGGWLAGLLCAHPEPFHAAILMNAVVKMDVAMDTLEFAFPVRESLKHSPVRIAQLNLLNHSPTTKNILLMQGLRDLFIPPDTLEELHRAWPGSELLPMNESHISINIAPRMLLRGVNWLVSKTRVQ